MKDEPDVSFAPRSPPNLRRVRLKPASPPTDKARRPGRRGDASSGDARALSPPRDASESAEESLGSPPDPPRFARVSQGSAFETRDDRVEWDACHDSDFDFDSAQTLRRSDPPPAPPPRCPRPDPTAVPPAASLSTPDDTTCEHCAELAARCAAADAAARHLSATLDRLRSTLDAVESLAERQAAHEQGSERHLNALESKLDSYRDALRRFTSVSPGDSLEHSPSRAEHERGSVPDRGRGRGGLRRERSTDALGVHKVHGGTRYEAYLPGKRTEIVPGDVPGA